MSSFPFSNANNNYLHCVIVEMSTTPVLSYAMYSQFHDAFCPGSSQDRVNSCSRQEGPWLESRGYSIPPHVIAGVGK